MSTQSVRLKNDDPRSSQYALGIPAAFYATDATGHITLFNQAAVDLWGREPEIGKDLWCGSWRIFRTDGSPMPLDECPMAEALREGRPVYGKEIIIERPDGERRYVLPHPKPILNSAGKVVEAINMLVDITDQKRADKALRESEERFRSMADQAPIMIWMSDASNKVTYVNQKWTEFTGLPKESGYGDGWIKGIHPEDRAEVISELNGTIQSRQTFTGKFRYKGASGNYNIISLTGSLRLNQSDEYTGYVGVLHDVTFQENAMAALENLVEERTRGLQDANLKLERSNHELEQFAFVASHDLQEPLRKIQIFADALYQNHGETLNDDARNSLEKIRRSAKRMSGQINDLLNFSRLTADADSFEKTDLNAVLDRVENDFELLLMQKKAVIKADPLPVVHAVPLQMNQLFFNILGNSLKFSSDRELPMIAITTRFIAKLENGKFPALDHGRSFHEIIFTDNGIGFDQKFADQIFVIFQRLGSRSLYEGSGIGLALCKKIVASHGGDIYAVSTENEGASFHVLLPAFID